MHLRACPPARLPLILPTHVSLACRPNADMLQEVREAEVALVAAAGAPPASMVLSQHLAAGARWAPNASASSSKPIPGRRRVLFVGPEGDFSPEEIEMLVGAGALPVGLGANRLRTETAALALLSLCCCLSDAEQHQPERC